MSNVRLRIHGLMDEDVILLERAEPYSEYIHDFLFGIQRFYAGYWMAWIQIEDHLIGYALFRVVKGSHLRSHDDYEDVADYIEADAEYLYIPYFEVFDGHQGKGYGSEAIQQLQKLYPYHELLLYSTDNSRNFWLNNRFTSKGYSDYWLTRQPISVERKTKRENMNELSTNCRRNTAILYG